MRIGLIRHFPVKHPFPTGWRTAEELSEWLRTYDASPVTVLDGVDLGPDPWAECVSSDMERAAVTAAAVFQGEFERTPLLREPEFAGFRTGRLRLPVRIWRMVLLFCWSTGHRSQRACRDDFRRRVEAAADLLEARTRDVLVVSHAAMMNYLSAELIHRGFQGPKLKIAKHATLHVYER